MQTEASSTLAAPVAPAQALAQGYFLPITLHKLQLVADSKPPRRTTSSFHQDECFWCLPFYKPISQLGLEAI